ncbi:MAG TPA: type II toxin-antitoxin system RelE/ParE family toxin [Chloroflexota bacterium]|nr:type II toxin-antitoxin system RelE/ParE family toxin [Chloroflexota bacterium]
MARVSYTQLAREDLLAIWSYIAADNPTAADRVLDAIDSRCARLGENSKLGRARPDIAPELRYFPVGNYLIFYREIRGGVEIVRVLHGARNLNAIFHSEEE